MNDAPESGRRDPARPIAGLLHAAASQLMLVDLQPRLLSAMCDAQVGPRAARLARYARMLDVPVWATTQSEAKLGAPIDGLAQDCLAVIDKQAFSVGATPVFHRLLGAQERRCIVIAGVEAHVCVLQSAVDLQAAGFDVCVVADAVSSRNAFDASTALARLASLGVCSVTSEMVMFEWTRCASHPQFQALQRLIK